MKPQATNGPPRGAMTLGHIAAALALTALLATTAEAQTGNVTGRIVDATNGQVINGAQVSVEGTSFGSLSDSRGRYLIAGVPEGTRTIRVTYIGYRSATQQVTVAAGTPTVADFSLEVSAVTLDEVVVTGTAGEVERKRLGASLASLDVAQIQEVSPVSGFGPLLEGRIPGVRSVGVVGGVGAGRDLRIRGMGSFRLNQRPAIYIDGVRLDSRNVEWAGGDNLDGGTCCAFSGGAGEDRLSDLNPEEIERIEILKGAAAATLYGSEASNGVIQIFTKRGRSGSAPSFTASVGTGFNRHRPNFPTKLYPKFTGPDGTRALDANETLIENGAITSFDLTAQGGGQDVTYFFSGAYHYEEGSVKPNDQTRGNMRLNLRWVPNQQWSFALNTSYARNRIWALQSGNNWMSLLGNATLGNPKRASAERPYGEPWTAVSDVQSAETFSDASRWTGGITASFAPTGWWSNKLTFGLDHLDDQKSRLLPWGDYFVYLGEQGEKYVGYRRAKNFTADYLGQLEFGLLESLSSSFSYGAQGYWEQVERSAAIGQGYAGPGVTTVGGAAQKDADEEFAETITVGVFAQNRFAFRDKLFATVGLRIDGHSAFGENYGLQTYPKFDASYVVTDDPWLPDFISSLRFRGAVGMAGAPPGAFEQFQTYDPTPVLEDVPGVEPDNPGNPELEPEKTTEIEGGFDVGFLDDRLGIEFTYYDATTRDALLAIALPSSEGFPDAQLQNTGKIKNTGWELAINATPVSSGRLRWDTHVTMDGNENEVLDLGPTAVDDRLGGYRVGYPVEGEWSRVITGYDPATNKHTRSDTAHYLGPRLPTFNAAFGNTFTVGPLRLYGQLRMEDGAVFGNSDRPYRIRQGGGDEYLRTLDASGNATPQTDSLLNHWTLVSAVDSRDQIRIQEVSLSYEVPEGLSARLGLGPTSITLAGFNLHWWDDCNCMDPSMTYRGGDSFSFSGFLAMPQPRQFLFTVRTRF